MTIEDLSDRYDFPLIDYLTSLNRPYIKKFVDFY